MNYLVTIVLLSGISSFATAADKRVVCYTQGWAHWISDPVQFEPEDVDTSLCTHMIFAFAELDNTTFTVHPHDKWDPDMFIRLTHLKRENHNLKVLLAVGGWTMGSAAFSAMVNTQHHMNMFAKNITGFLRQYDFDGLDLDWEYPGDRGSPASDKHQFTVLLQTLYSYFQKEATDTQRPRLLLSAAVTPSPYRTQQSYEVPDIANYVDFLNAMAYDLHGTWENQVGHHSSLYSPTNDPQDSIDYVLSWFLNQSIPADKVNLGIAFYGTTYTLTDPAQTQIGAPITGAGAAGDLVKQSGYLYYYEVCKIITEHNDTINEMGKLPGTNAPYLVDGNRWTGYDDPNSIREKVDYALAKGLGGVFIWSIEMDDFHGLCGGGHYPLMHAVQKAINVNQGEGGMVGR